MMTTTLAAFGFLVPGLAIAGAIAVSIPIIIHILSKRPRKPREWAAMRFLLAAYKRHRTRTRLEQILLLLTRCAIVLLLGFALAGPILSALGVLGDLTNTGRVLVVVLDDSVTAKAVDPATGKPRFDAMKSMATKLIDEMGPGDRVALITTSRPAEGRVTPPTNDPNAVRNRIVALEPTDAAAEMGEALRLAQSAIDELENKPRSIFVALLSDFSQGSASIEQQLPQSIEKLGEVATLLRPDPAPSLNNVQIESLRPDRKAVIRQTAETAATVTWNIRVRRFTPGAPAGELTMVRLTAPEVAPIRRNVTWAEGQTVADVRIDTPLGETGVLGAEAAIEQSAPGADTLAADNERHALIRVRQNLTVLVIDEPGEDVGKDLTPRIWLTTALAPVADTWSWPIDIKRQDPATIDGEASALPDADIIYVLRPDLLDAGGWAAIKKWLDRGGLAWFTPPAPNGPAIWASKLTETFGFEWGIGAEPVAVESNELDADGLNPLPGALAMKTDGIAPPELARLSADLPDLLGAIEVYRYLPIDRATLTGETDVLVEAVDGKPMLIASTIPGGGGRVLLSAAAVDTTWTNLPTKPLFVPLNHEVLRAAIDLLQPDNAYAPGDRPALGDTFDKVPALKSPTGEQVLLVQSKLEDSAAEITRPTKPFKTPGLYTSATATLAVNVDAESANTLAVEGAMLDAWLGTAGEWQPLDRDAPAKVFAENAEEADLSWPLLWAVLILALIETFLARYVSHASKVKRVDNVIDMARPTARPT